MFIINTAEIRWFYPGHTTPGAHQWLIQGGGSFEDQQVRTDHYLIIRGRDNLGIKLREGRIEIKKRLQSLDNLSSGSISGCPETWIKWSLKSVDEELPGTAALPGGPHWVSIHKKRMLQRFAIDGSGRLQRYPVTGFPEKGITVELCDLEIEGKSWWTFGIECYGTADTVQPDLTRHFQALTRDLPIPETVPSRSYGYPAWILRTFNEKPRSS